MDFELANVSEKTEVELAFLGALAADDIVSAAEMCVKLRELHDADDATDDDE